MQYFLLSGKLAAELGQPLTHYFQACKAEVAYCFMIGFGILDYGKELLSQKIGMHLIPRNKICQVVLVQNLSSN